MKPREITVSWEDHHENPEWTEATEKSQLAPLIVKTRGYLVQENRTMIEVARDVYQTGSGIGSPLRIMKKCILKRSYR